MCWYLLSEEPHVVAGLHDDCGGSITLRCSGHDTFHRHRLSSIQWVGLCIGPPTYRHRSDSHVPGCDGWDRYGSLYGHRHQWTVHPPVQHEGGGWASGWWANGNLCSCRGCDADNNADLHGAPLPETGYMDAGLRLAKLWYGLSADTGPCSGHDPLNRPSISQC